MPNWRSLVRIHNPQDRWCLARALVLGLADWLYTHQQQRPLQHFRQFADGQQGDAGAHLAVRLLHAAGLPLTRQLYGSNRDFWALQRLLDRRCGGEGRVRLVVLERSIGFRVRWKGPRVAEHTLCVLLHRQHYCYVQRVEQVFQVYPSFILYICICVGKTMVCRV